MSEVEQQTSDAPRLNLLRLALDGSPTKLEIESFQDDELSIAARKWRMIATPLDPDGAKNLTRVMQQMVQNRTAVNPGILAGDTPGVQIHRYLRGYGSHGRAAHGDYLIECGDDWVFVMVVARAPHDEFEAAEVERVLATASLAEEPALDRQVLPAWEEFLQNRQESDPDGKFLISLEPAPIMIGNFDLFEELEDQADLSPDDDDVQRGGRALDRQLIEFYVLDEPLSIRCDLWVNREPEVSQPRELVFRSKLEVAIGRIEIWSADEIYQYEVPNGKYDASIYVVERGKICDDDLTDREFFRRDDLERYEIVLKPIG
ncbi:hypothetical protein LOC68_09040 [Blastopirellula sp. JC732]|uniref:Uncharacterized protein n=1 Tax=Blastopirellula sediminis TaxID=2894196 RepID=A0A9X1SF19_9BACT|nr:hypothetical protein [Blastopirellula sediminis]MCC9608683.1 hypothetical protein [Blastopirellula sediminis]MCC9628540.1 hypothetical protein [Blastopirellula sediminis]